MNPSPLDYKRLSLGLPQDGGRGPALRDVGQEEAASLTDIPTLARGDPAGELADEQAKELLAVPDRSTLKGKRDFVILALLVGCAIRRNELAEGDVATIQQRKGRWVLADLEGKDRHIRTVAIPGSSAASTPG